MISDAIKKMQAMARKAQEETYDGKCTVTEFQPIKDSRTKDHIGKGSGCVRG